MNHFLLSVTFVQNLLDNFYITIQKVTVNFGILISTYLSSYLIQQVNKLCLLFLQMQLRIQKSANKWKIIEILSKP